MTDTPGCGSCDQVGCESSPPDSLGSALPPSARMAGCRLGAPQAVKEALLSADLFTASKFLQKGREATFLGKYASTNSTREKQASGQAQASGPVQGLRNIELKHEKKK